MEKDKLLDGLLDVALQELNKKVDERVDKLQASIEAKVEGVEVGLRERIATLDSYTTQAPLVVNIGKVGKPKSKVVHSSLDLIMRILKSTKRKEKNIMLVGGAGSGKTHLVSTIAEALDRQFYPMSVGLQTTKSDLLGFINATGNYITTPLRKAYEEGGVLLLDEFDSAHAGVVTILNSLLANGHCSFPDKIITKHQDFICLCACNTYGKGGSIDYVGRNRLDGATLDRFIMVNVGYDTQLERALTNHKPWEDVIYKIRENIASHGIKMIVSPRALMDGADLLDEGICLTDVLDMVIFKGCDDDIIAKLMDGVDLEDFKSIPPKFLSKLTGTTHEHKSKEESGSSPTPSVSVYGRTGGSKSKPWYNITPPPYPEMF